MAMNIKDIESLIKKKIPDAEIVIKDLAGDKEAPINGTSVSQKNYEKENMDNMILPC